MILAALSLLCFQSAAGTDQVLAEAAAFAQQGDYTRALAALDQAATADVRIVTARGTYLLRDAESRAAAGLLSGDRMFMAFEEAVREFERASEMPAPPVEAFVNWSEALLNLQDVSAALRALKKGEAAFPRGDLELSLQLGRVCTAKANSFAGLEEKQRAAFAEARDIYRAAAGRFPASAAACVRLGEMEMQLGSPDAARAAWQQAVDRDLAAVDVGAMIQWLGGGPAAEILATRVGSDSRDAMLVWWLGYAEYYAQPQQWTAAKKHFLKALDLNPEFANTWYFLGEGALQEGARLVEAGNSEAANKEYRFAAKAWASYLKDYGANHLQGLRQMEDRGASGVEQIMWLSGKAYGGRDLNSALGLAQWVTTANPMSAEAWNNYAFFAREGGQAEESLRAYKKADYLQPDDPQILNDMAVILHYYLRRDQDEAAALYRRAASLAEAQLAAAESMTPADRERVRIALRDARNNLRRLNGGSGEEQEQEAGGEGAEQEAGTAGQG